MNRLISCFANSYLKFGLDAAVENLPKIGIENLEFPIRTAGTPTYFGDTPWLTDASTEEDVVSSFQKVQSAGLRISSANVSSGNPLKPEVLQTTLRKLKVAAGLKVSRVVGGAGECESESQRPQLMKHLEEIGNTAAELGIVYCFETHPGVSVNPTEMLRTMCELDHPHLRLNYDTGNITYYNRNVDVLEGLRSVREFVQHVHLKDHNGQLEDWHFPALGEGGSVDFLKVRESLDEIGFTGPYSFELEGITGETPELERCQQRLADSMEHLRKCGYFE
ncbi:sugar phosphate isomerase/epimerase family protein [Thalassoroseus pseudoceratinae]|uniref:sugar phosphate isomerase/epimerase family protein n=1 Tax=Thalassoroseus pseudoceratinae TaxID=2713176 RepID=UPI001422CE64|nr:sugar phosphate isomerase/epimerase [Thalassoroseus pseudoceratinae]